MDNEIEVPVDQTPGALLLAARETQQLSQAAVAERLHLSTQVIKDLERDDYSHFTAQIYVLGHLRSYSRLLGLEAADVIASYKKLYVEPLKTEIPSIDMSLGSAPIRSIEGQQVFKWVSWFVAVMMVVLVFSWWHGQTTHHSANVGVQVVSSTLPVDGINSSHKSAEIKKVKPQVIPVSMDVTHSANQPVSLAAKPASKPEPEQVEKPKAAKQPLTPNYKVD